MTDLIGHLAAPTPLHEHAWELRSVDYEDGLAVSSFECVECGSVRCR